MRGDDDHRHVVPLGPEPFEDLHAAEPGHLQVEQDEVDVVGLEPGQRGLAVLGGGQFGAGRFQRGSEDEPDVGLVVDDQDVPGVTHDGCSSCPFAAAPSEGAVGKVKVNVVPRPGWLSASIRPPWASTISRAIARPSPAPPDDFEPGTR